ncbi:SMI1/KNR4 family protein [Brevifollis gellanilyticus]|uniref:Knr4/Smi1-like domain-containing protein n=1 Tax=Brevifollis gellanilyticus TaxID=748831 RepID=A0A512MD15_9BACT|nr:SMI1/KNR4 family protein [Brevifollis gellanilyticus]GEP44261.1 hypothetical protein BGE01nite_35520 [Brevifollis gellanilyticus]
MKIVGTQTPPPASVEKRNALEAMLPPDLPADYLILFENYDGADIWFDDVDWSRDEFDYLRLDSVDEMLDVETRATLSETFPGLFVIGSDGGGQILAYDSTRPKPWPIVMHLPGYSKLGSAPVVASSMTELMQRYLKA